MLQAALRVELSRAAGAEKEAATAELRQIREGAEAALSVEARRAAEVAAQSASRSLMGQMRGLVESAAVTEVRKAATREVAVALRDEANTERVCQEKLRQLRLEVRAAAEKELAELCGEDRYHRVNAALLADLEERADRAIKLSRAKAEESIQAAQGSLRIAQAMSVAAIALAGYSLLQRSRL